MTRADWLIGLSLGTLAALPYVYMFYALSAAN